MTTVSDLLTAIADDVDDTTGEYTPQIKRAVTTAVRYCERKNFYFNETRDITFMTVTGQEWYGAAANVNIPTLVRIQAAYREQTNNQRTELIRVRPDEIEWLNDFASIQGPPDSYAYFDRQIRLYPKPNNSTDVIRLQLGPYRLAFNVEAGSDANVWVNEGYDLIKARAKYVLYKDTLKEPTFAAEALNDFNDQLVAIEAETALRGGTGQIAPTEF